MRLSIRTFVASLALSSVALSAELSEQLTNWKTLPAAEQSSLAEQLNGKRFSKLSAEERLTVQKKCVALSGDLIGRAANGKLKKVKDELPKLILKVAGDYLANTPPAETPAHPKAEELYGSIPDDAARINRLVSIDPTSERWHSTGLYAAPGEVVKLKFPKQWVGKNLSVQLSGHRDQISLKKNLERLPKSPARSFKVDQEVIEVASAFGGAIYIDTGDKPQEKPSFPVAIKNALEAPYFVLGKSSVEEWKEKGRQAPAPYAELVTPRVALSFPSAWIREMEDPTALLEYWDKVVQLHDELGGLSKIRTMPERVNVDVQISNGLFHAGYPMQGPQQHCKGVVDLEALKSGGNWGWFHELGHEAQRRPDKAWSWNNAYTFDGSIECTVNLFSAHAFNRLGITPRGGWSWTADPKQVDARAKKALATGKGYPELGVGDKLAMFLQIRDEFGWQPIAQVLKSYSDQQTAKPGSLPKDNQAKRDQMLIRLSNATKHNLTEFMGEIWKIPLSEEAKKSVENLPTWKPKNSGLN